TAKFTAAFLMMSICIAPAWGQQRCPVHLIAADGAASDTVGSSVAVSGGTAVLGDPNANSGRGSAYVFVLSGTTWVFQAKLTASDGATGDGFGTSVSISGNTAVVGANG